MVVNTRSTSRHATRSSARHKPPSHVAPVAGGTAKRTKQLAVTTKQKKSTDEERMITSPEEAMQVPPAAQVVDDQGLKESVPEKKDDKNEAGFAPGQVRIQSRDAVPESYVNDRDPMDSISGTSTTLQPPVTRSRSSMTCVLVPPPPTYICAAKQRERITINSNDPLSHHSPSVFATAPLPDFESMQMFPPAEYTVLVPANRETSARSLPMPPLPSPPSVHCLSPPSPTALFTPTPGPGEATTQHTPMRSHASPSPFQQPTSPSPVPSVPTLHPGIPLTSESTLLRCPKTPNAKTLDTEITVAEVV
ncbi:hypothetical protein PQX77_002570 [Marasmius sp. AFHP31]|nr:hypothetical protein PQX77_002570 [Marasmius sp. AFHP31]